MRHLKPLDGVRAIAVLMVMLFHFGYFAAGWVGVQVFFTLSGYLITRILLRARVNRFTAYAANFYWHRALRILPLLYAFVIASAAGYLLFGVPASFGSDWPWLVTFTANFARMTQTDLGPCFVHIWSLAVEQQFYLVWPVLIFFLPPQAFRFLVGAILLLTPLIRFLVFQHLIQQGFDGHYAGKAAYVLPFTQFDAFAAGAAIALWNLEQMRFAGRWFLMTLAAVAAAGLGVLTSSYFDGTGAFVGSLGYSMYLLHGYEYVWGYSLLNILSMLGIVCALRGVGPMRLLEARILVWIGKISYGVYVYHLPLLLLGEFLMERYGIGIHGLARPAFFAAWMGTVILVSNVSFRWLETPFLKFKNHTWMAGQTQPSRG